MKLLPTNLSRLHWAILPSVLVFLFIVYQEVQLLTKQPWLGLDLAKIEQQVEVDTSIKPDKEGLKVIAIQRTDLANIIAPNDIIFAIKSAAQGYTPLTGNSLAEDPEQYASFNSYQQILIENQAIYSRLLDGQITLKMHSGREVSLNLQQQHRSLSSLPLNFWISNATALVGLFFAIFMLTYRPQRLEICLLSLIGFCFAIGSTAIAVFSSRNLVLDPDWYYWLLIIANLMKAIVAYSLLGLVLIYPYRLASNRWVAFSLLIAIIGWLNIIFQWTDLPGNTFYFTMIVAFTLKMPLFIMQWLRSHNAPVERAALIWMILPIYIAVGSELLLFLLPASFGIVTTLPAWVSQVIFLPLYLGFIFGVFKYRLFAMEHWWLISWQWVLSGFLFISIDLILFSLFNLHASLAFGLTMILMAWIYFPLRQWIWNVMGKEPEIHLEDHIYSLIQTFIGGHSSHDFRQRWKKLLMRVFSASSATIIEGELAKPKISNNGMVLQIPGINAHCHIDLYGRNQSSRLFNQQDIILADTLAELARHTKTQRQAQEKGALLERSRIMRDLHDDVGANLLSMIYRANSDEDLQLAQDTLRLLRETIYTLDDKITMRLSIAIAKWHQEIRQRCQHAQVKLLWRVNENIPRVDLSARQHINLGRVLREILSNALKHARPSIFAINFIMQDNKLKIQIKHNGEIKPLNTWSEGKGIPSINKRVQELQGAIDWVLLENQLQIDLLIPL